MHRGLKFGLGIVAVLVAGVAIYDRVEAQQCKRRGATYDARQAELSRAIEQLPIGATRQSVESFFAANDLPLRFGKGWRDQDEAQAVIHMQACSPGWYCGDSAVIIVTVRFDQDWRVSSKKVDGGFNNWL